ncbi:FAD-dependent monooxygenase [Kribbella monticola]|uniref:FAD-dependent monooxygenase n=1 Tax=Kribbella monticola TaxID=2185285 RepID=UPI000DD4E629|nr:FAD-dependent monooxygenase [Kribbella monticola]
MKNPDVLIVGAGPTGLLLATELSLAGVSIIVVDKALQRSGQSKALTIQPRSAEILHSRGLLEPLLDEVVERLPAGHFAGLEVPLEYASWETRFPCQLGIPQARIEEHLEQHLMTYGVQVARGLTLTGLTQDDDGVLAEFDGGTTVRAGWVVGCDGGRSAVRKLSEIAFPGRDGRFSAVVADVVVADNRPGSRGWELPSLVPREGAVMSILPLGDGVYRALFTGPDQQGLTGEVTFDEVARALTGWYGDEVVLRELRWGSRFTDAVRQAAQYRKGRVFLAGDAAHIHSPTGGQGMNLGLQDAFNLGWKLAAYLKDGVDLLDSYHAERHPVGAAVLANTRAQGVLMVPDDDVACLRGIFVELMKLPSANKWLAGLVSGLGVRYEQPGEHPLTGQRMPDLELGTTSVAELLRPGRHLRLELSGWAEAARVVVRPDGYVLWAADEPTAEWPEFAGGAQALTVRSTASAAAVTPDSERSFAAR